MLCLLIPRCSPAYVCPALQPRRVAAMSVAKRVSEEMGVELGQDVSCSLSRGCAACRLCSFCSGLLPVQIGYPCCVLAMAQHEACSVRLGMSGT